MRVICIHKLTGKCDGRPESEGDNLCCKPHDRVTICSSVECDTYKRGITTGHIKDCKCVPLDYDVNRETFPIKEEEV